MAERNLVSLEDVSLHFGGKPLFEGLYLHIAEHDKICLVGKNGAGKTSLMRLITGELEPDAGRRYALPGLGIGYLAQQVAFDGRDTVRAFVLAGLADEEDFSHKEHLADIVIAPLGLEPDAVMATLSGGQLRRAALAQALITEPDVLLLDEPTNHLDIGAIEWLEQYLHGYRGALVCVSHDRAFLAAISRKVFWLDRGAIRICPKGYGEFEAWSELMLEQEARELQNMQKKLAAEVDWTQGGVTGRRKRNQRRLSELHRLREKLKSEKASYNQMIRTIEIDPLKPTPASKIVAEFKQVSKCFHEGGKVVPILQAFDLRILRGDRIGIVGKNGSGKSTFIKLLTGEIAPDEGRIFRSKTLDISYFDQNRASLNPNKTLWDTLCPNGGDYVYLGSGDKPRPQHVCGYLKDFLFDPKMARDRVSTLSGGQQNRLMLAKMLAHPGNLLILDEPTNDLDMDTLDMLQEILADYSGTLLIVSHDRDFLDRTVTEILAFEGDAQIEEFIGGYSDYHAAKKKAALPPPKVVTAKAPPAGKKKKGAPLSYKYKHELEQLPHTIAALERELATLKQVLSDADLYTSNPAAFDDATSRFATLQQELEQAETRWLELEEMRRESGD